VREAEKVGVLLNTALSSNYRALGDDPLQAPGQWWGERQAGFFGGLAGAFLGLCGALVGYLSPRGKGRRFVIGLMSACAAAGVLALVAGVVALLQHQPYAVFYPLLLFGVLATSICGGLIPVVRRRYAALELRKLEAAAASC
jgi:MFS family permease